MRKLLVIFLVLIIILAGVGVWYWHRNSYSKEILRFEILGPQEVQCGQEVEYTVRMKNNGNIRLEDLELMFQSPEHSLLEDSESLIVRQKLEDLYPGEERTYTFRARVFGKEGDVLQAKALLTYRPKNLKTIYESRTELSSKIVFTPITLEFDLPSKTESGQEMNFSLNYFSNIDYLLENIRVRVQYPQGFHFNWSRPTAIDNTDWDIPSLYKASGGRIQIKGTLEGKENEEKVFRAQLGIIRNDQFWLLKEVSQSVQIVQSPLYISLRINNSPNYTASPSDFLHYEILFRNIGNSPVQKKFLVVRLDGEFFDLSTLAADKGEVGRGDSTILWDWKDVSALRFLDAGEEGKVDFWVKLKDNIPQKIKNPLLRVTASIAGIERVFETKITTKTIFTQKVYFHQDVFENKGPLPPRVGQSTEYAVFWYIKNYWNDLRNVKIRAKLADNVSLTGRILPENAPLTFDPESKEVLLTIDEIPAFSGLEENASSTLAFQISLLPTSDQRHTVPILIREVELTGEDIFTGQEVQERLSFVDATLPDDDTVDESQAIVQ